MTPLSMAALPDVSAGVTIAIVAIVFIILWRQYRRIYMLAFGIAFGAIAEVLILRGVEESIGPLSWRAPVADASFITATIFLLAGCMALSGRRIPWLALVGGGAGLFLVAQIGAALGVAGVIYIPELGAFAYVAIAYMFFSRPAAAGNRMLGYLFAARAAVNLPWLWANPLGLSPYIHNVDQVMIVTIGWSLVVTELTRGRRQAEAANIELLRSERKFRDYAEIASDWFWETGPTHEFTYISERIAAFGVDRVTRLGRRRWEGSYNADADSEKWRAHRAVLERREAFRDFVYRNRRDDGSLGYVCISGTPNFDVDGRFLGYRGVGSDVTVSINAERALREAKDAAEAANKAKSTFLANMNHELRTPLNAITGMSEIIEQQMFGPTATERYRAYAADIHASGLHLLGMINDILDMAKIESGKSELHAGDLVLGDTVAEIVRILGTEADAAGLTLETAVAANLPVVRADEQAIRRILFNLLSNALKFTPRGGRITVLVRSGEAGFMELSVADTGIGIAAEHIPKLMQPFVQIENAYQRSYHGTGLGLALVRSLVELHGGSIAITSAPDRGTVVTIQLPVALAERAPHSMLL
jgi:PAS domain S-box-containing protein